METTNVFSMNNAEVRYEIIRNITTERQKRAKQTVLVGIINSDQLLHIPDQDNVRRFLGNQSKATGAVQKAIERTLEEHPDEFSILNGGVTIVAKAIRIDDSSKKINLIGPSIINGSQSRGVMNVYHTHTENPAVPVKVEIIVTTDEDLVADISIARNFQTKVKNMSIAGRQGAFDPLNSALEYAKKPYRLNTDESEKTGLEPTLALQIMFLLMPQALWDKHFPKVVYKKSAIYSSTAKWLDLFADNYNKAQDGDRDSADLMQYFIDIIGEALDLYNSLVKSQEFKGSRISNGITRDEDNNIVKVSNGWIFPILAGYSKFIKHESSGWKIDLPTNFDLQKFITVAKEIYHQKPDVNALGKNPLAYAMMEMTAGNLYN